MEVLILARTEGTPRRSIGQKGADFVSSGLRDRNQRTCTEVLLSLWRDRLVESEG